MTSIHPLAWQDVFPNDIVCCDEEEKKQVVRWLNTPQNEKYATLNLEGFYLAHLGTLLRMQSCICKIPQYPQQKEGAFKAITKCLRLSPENKTFVPCALVQTKWVQKIDGFNCNGVEAVYLQWLQKHPQRGLPAIHAFAFRPDQEQGQHRLSQFVAIQDLYEKDFFEVIQRHLQNPLDRASIRRFEAQLLGILISLHRAGITHRDIKPENFLVDEKNNLLLTDFASACHGGSKETEFPCPETNLRSIAGSPLYFAPESHYFFSRIAGLNQETLAEERAKYIQPAVDVWAVGLIILALENKETFLQLKLQQSEAVPSTRHISYFHNEAEQDKIFPQPKGRDAVLHLAWEMLRPHPTNRITAEEALRKLLSIFLQEQ